MLSLQSHFSKGGVIPVKNKKAVAKTQTLIELPEADEDFMCDSSADLAEAGYGFFHEFSESVRYLYLVSGEVYRVGESDLIRIR